MAKKGNKLDLNNMMNFDLDIEPSKADTSLDFQNSFALDTDTPEKGLRKEVDPNELLSNILNEFSMEEDDEFIALVDSIKEEGVKEDIHVYQNPAGKYVIISGHRRTAAAKLAGLKTVPIKIEGIFTSRMEELDGITIYNVSARQKKPLDLARMYKLYEEEYRKMGITTSVIPQVAKKLAVSERSLAYYIKLLELPEYLQSLVEKKILAVNLMNEVVVSSANIPNIVDALQENAIVNDETEDITKRQETARKIVLEILDKRKIVKRNDGFERLKKEEKGESVSMHKAIKKLYKDFSKYKDFNLEQIKSEKKKTEAVEMVDDLLKYLTDLKRKLK